MSEEKAKKQEKAVQAVQNVPAQEETFAVAEIVEATANLFSGKYKPYLVAACFKNCGNKRFTKSEAIKMVTSFAERKVEK